MGKGHRPYRKRKKKTAKKRVVTQRRVDTRQVCQQGGGGVRGEGRNLALQHSGGGKTWHLGMPLSDNRKEQARSEPANGDAETPWRVKRAPETNKG